MKSPFLDKYRITQIFGDRANYYGKFGLKGHEGIDLVPLGGTAWGIHALEGGTVIVDDDDGDKRGAAYGISVRIRTKDNKVFLYAHMSENCVKLGDVIETGQLIGIMGNTGGSKGAHLHLSVYHVNDNGEKLNANNGYAGCVDPYKEVV